MKAISTLALLAGMIFVVPSFAHETENGFDVNHKSDAQGERSDLQHEALKKFVNEALDAHKGKAPAEMRAHFEEIKKYVELALDAENNKALILGSEDEDGYLDTFKKGILKVISADFDSLYIHWVKTAPCFIQLPDSDDPENLKAMKLCLKTIIKPDAKIDLSHGCMAETCRDYPKLKEACVMIAGIIGESDSIQDCSAASFGKYKTKF